MYPVNDPQAVREPRPDTSYLMSGNNGLDISDTGGVSQIGFGVPLDGSRQFQWGWAPVGGARSFDDPLTPNSLVLSVQIGTVTINVT